MSHHESDSTLVWSLAANCRLYEDDPGPRQLNVGSATEPRYVPRSEALRDLYASQLVLGVDADTSRIDALADRCRAEIEAIHKLLHWIRIMGRRMTGPGRLSYRLRSALEIMDPHEREALRAVHHVRPTCANGHRSWSTSPEQPTTTRPAAAYSLAWTTRRLQTSSASSQGWKKTARSSSSNA
jgi:hypothetical protein